MKVYLNKNKSCFSNNVEGVVNATLSTKNRLLPNNDITTTFSILEQYNKERDECRKFRLIFNINPVCSNVLFNNKTEIVVNEGSDNTKCLFMDKTFEKPEYATNSIKNISYIDAIRNTEYSHPSLGNFIYHCGLDIFNNHMLRNNGFVHVNKNNEETSVYNTIEDTLRYNDGTSVIQNINPLNETFLKTRHLYRYDSILSFKKAFSERCKEKDGWWGFINPSNINIPNRDTKTQSGNTIVTNQMLANNKPCEFIDLYPDRSLFSFNPKYNKHRKRIEKNWDYCITYPCKSDYNLVNTICECDNNSIKALCSRIYNTNGIEIVQCESYFNHNLKVGDYISVFYKDENGLQIYNNKIKVVRVGDLNGDNTHKVFAINYSDIQSIYKRFDGFLHFKKNVNGVDCNYYARVFAKIGELNSDINKIAFGKNIYGDDVSQIIFTDDINIDGLKDNNGRPVSEVYLTIVKRNAGHEEWYNPNGDLSSEDIEYSHCFGEVTSGIDFSGIKDEPDLYNIHKMHNIKTEENNNAISNTVKCWGESLGSLNNNKIVFKNIIAISKDITINDETFKADIVEYDIVNATETIISPIYHRFNTKQREIFDARFRDILHDVIVADDYDVVLLSNDYSDFTIRTQWINEVMKSNKEYGTESNTDNLMYGNISPEGYFYNPHYRVRLIEESGEVSRSDAKLINYKTESFEFNEKTKEAKFDVPTNFGFYKGDCIAFYNKMTKETIWGEIVKVIDNNITLRFDNEIDLRDNDFVSNNKKQMYAYWSTDNVPTYAKLEEKGRNFIWRKLVPQSELTQDHELYETTFSNGRLYIEKNINFFLRRQDPTGKYGLSKPIYKTQMLNNPMKNYIIKGYEPYDFSINNITTNNFDNCY
jgi:hypothetical protein